MYKLAKERENRIMALREIYEKKNNSWKNLYPL
jgi:hypothetical protein